MSEATLLCGDIGGTNARLALVRVQGSATATLRTERYPSSSAPALGEILLRFLAGSPGTKIDAAALAVAGPVVDGRCEATNLPWVLDQRDLGAQIGCSRTTLLNDLQALAFGVLFLPPEQLVSLNGLPHPGRGNAAVIAAGTGLGEAYLFWDGTRYHPSASEGGHGEFGPRNAVELKLAEYLIAQKGHPSTERVASGPGFGLLYDFLKDSGLESEPPDLAHELAQGDRNARISQFGLEGRYPICTRTMDLFVDVLGAEAGNMALRAVATGGVFVGGGVSPKILPRLRDGRFLRAFADKGRFRRFAERIPVSVVLADDTGLLGATHFARLSL